MLNTDLGEAGVVDGRTRLLTCPGRSGHAVYGPYVALEPGRYRVDFTLAVAENHERLRDFLCAVLDITHDSGNQRLARKDVYHSQLRDGRSSFSLDFSLDRPARVEYRVWVNGKAALDIDRHRRLIRLDGADTDVDHGRDFPEEPGEAIPFFRENRALLRSLYEADVGVAIRHGAVVLTVNGTSFYARSTDDLTFIGEVFHENTYNIRLDRPACIIDIGMNIGLTSLMLAAKPEVAEVHAFEPFRNTYDRALANLSLNPAAAAKINAHNIGLSDGAKDDTILIADTDNSGARSTVAMKTGKPVHIRLEDAASRLAPVIADAEAKGRAIVVKVDCEGSEFAVFRSLNAAGLLPRVDAFMVEWHAMFEDRTREDLIAPLRRAGFLVFDRAPPSGNGFFYAARIAPAAAPA